MARFHARNGRLLVSPTNGTAATPIANITSFKIEAKSDRTDVTSFLDTTKTYVQGLSDAQGSFAGFRDSGAKQLLSAAQDGLSRAWYFYEDYTNLPSAYFFGTGYFDISIDASVADAAKISGTWASATPMSTSGLT